MVLGYWNIAASLVTMGAVDGDAFRAAHDEIFATFSKIHPHLAELRTASGEPDFCKHMEAVVLAVPNAEEILGRRRKALPRRANRGRISTQTETLLEYPLLRGSGRMTGNPEVILIDSGDWLFARWSDAIQRLVGLECRRILNQQPCGRSSPGPPRHPKVDREFPRIQIESFEWV